MNQQTNENKANMCKRCGKKLKSKKAIELGMGPTCWKKYQAQNNSNKLFKKEILK